MTPISKKYFETRPGLDSLRYVLSYTMLTGLARRGRRRQHQFFTEMSSNIDRHIVSEGYFEKGLLDALREVIMAADHRELMIDIGANIGNHTVALADLFQRVESVEPHPVLFRVLTANVLRNKVSHATCHNFGLANEDTTGTLAEPAGEHSIGRVKERSQLPPETFGRSAEEFGNEFPIELKSALDFVGAFGKSLDRAFIKIDVEGMEQEIVTAIRPLLERYKPIVGFEWFTKAQPDLTDIALGLEGYELWGIRTNDHGRSLAWRACKLLFTGRKMTLERIDPRQLDEVYPLALLVPEGRLS